MESCHAHYRLTIQTPNTERKAVSTQEALSIALNWNCIYPFPFEPDYIIFCEHSVFTWFSVHTYGPYNMVFVIMFFCLEL